MVVFSGLLLEKAIRLLRRLAPHLLEEVVDRVQYHRQPVLELADKVLRAGAPVFQSAVLVVEDRTAFVAARAAYRPLILRR
jgi:hypothetical protein